MILFKLFFSLILVVSFASLLKLSDTARVKYKDFSEFSGVADVRKPTSFILCWWFGFLFFWLM